MSEIVYVDDWSALHLIANLVAGMFVGAKHYNFIKSFAVITAAGIAWEIFEELYPDSHETTKDHITDMILNTLGFSAGFVLGNELKK